jgi:antitoxin CptB
MLPPDADTVVRHQDDPARRRRLRWRSRRGLLENDLVLTRFLDANESTLTDEEVGGLVRLLDLSDNALMDLLLGRSEPDGDLNDPHARLMLDRLRAA